MSVAGRVRARIRVQGIVQGVGFRPFVYALASRLGIDGLVGNDTHGVFIEAEGSQDAVAALLDALRTEAPALAVVEDVAAEPIRPTGERGFVIAASAATGSRQTLISPDMATCADCLAELFDPADRRYRYPFINCTNCGPRFTIVTDVPYDRAATTMASFAMCADCHQEYTDPANRRYHAQPVCCAVCGPAIELVDRDGTPRPGDPIVVTASLLADGDIVAVKGLGGYHLAADATNELAVAALRARKHREDKPFAVLAADLDAARSLVDIDAAAARLLSGARRPIVLLPRRTDAATAPSVAPGNRYLGVLLPYTPVHHLLVRQLGGPLVLTSGNVSDEPIAYRDDDALARLAGIADSFLVSNRPIHVRTDDSVVRVVRGRELPIRRSRGYAPGPLTLPRPSPRPVLATGAELKNTFCLTKGRHAFLSHHIGDLENYETLRAFTDGIAHFRRLFDVDPQVIAHDLHPEYLSTKWAYDNADDMELVGVQHHHAHIASCLADNGYREAVIGIALDGLGYGTDGTLWGGELLVADLAGFARVGHLAQVRMPGGAAAVREPWRMAAAYLGDSVDDLDVVRRNTRWTDVVRLAASGLNAPVTSSAGRLFDAVAAIVGTRDVVSYEGQAAVELEQCVDVAERAAYDAEVDDQLVVHGHDLVAAVVKDVRGGVPAGIVAARFHNGLALALARAAELVRERTSLSTVALSGGVFQNLLLLDRLVDELSRRGFVVLTHSRVPPNDGGISLGQAAVAIARDRAGCRPLTTRAGVGDRPRSSSPTAPGVE